MHGNLALLIDHWKADPRSNFNSWFNWEEWLKNFRSIRRGPYSQLKEHRGAIARFGRGVKPMLDISQRLT